MIIAKNDEDKRSRVWNYVTGITTVLIIIVVGYFIYQGFFGNPLEGKWKHDESDMILEVDDHNEAELDWKNLIDGKDVEVELGYTLDIKAKQITFTVKQEELDETAKELGDNVTASEVEQAINSVLTTFNYSVDGTELTLMETRLFLKKQANKENPLSVGTKVRRQRVLCENRRLKADDEEGYKSNKYRRKKDRRRESGSDPVHDKYKDRGCGSYGCADSCA